MTTKKMTINGAESLSTAIGELRRSARDNKRFQISIDAGKNRSSKQNAMLHAWYRQASVEEGNLSPVEVARLCQYHYGLKILRGDDDHFNNVCVATIDSINYDNALLLMDYIKITSTMTTRQMARYLEMIQKHYAGRVDLQFPAEQSTEGHTR